MPSLHGIVSQGRKFNVFLLRVDLNIDEEDVFDWIDRDNLFT